MISQSGFLTEAFAGRLFAFGEIVRRVGQREGLIRGGGVGGVGRIENARGAASIEFIAQFRAHGGRHVDVLALDDFLQKRGADRIDEVRGEDARGHEIDRIGGPVVCKVTGRIRVIKMPGVGLGIQARAFNFIHGHFFRMDVMDREKTGDAQSTGRGRDETGHPIVAMNKVGFDVADDAVDDLALEGQGDARILSAIT